MLFSHALMIAMLWATVFTLIAVALPVGYGRRADMRWDGILFVFLIVWLATWAFGGWMVPAGPLFWGVPWLSFFFLAFFFFMMLTASAPSPRRRPVPQLHPTGMPAPPQLQERKEMRREEESAILFGISFWLLLVVLVTILVARYAWSPHLA
jgi:hypothetical protein